MAAVAPSSCSVFIQAWVDVNPIIQGQSGTNGVYLVDNRVSSGSTGGGSAGLTTACTNGSYICWEVVAVDPNAQISQLQIQQIGNSQAWGNTGQPESTGGGNTVFTGQVQNTGTASYNLVLNVNDTTVTLTPSVTVS
jgi:hypothetical protein